MMFYLLLVLLKFVFTAGKMLNYKRRDHLEFTKISLLSLSIKIVKEGGGVWSFCTFEDKNVNIS